MTTTLNLAKSTTSTMAGIADAATLEARVRGVIGSTNPLSSGTVAAHWSAANIGHPRSLFAVIATPDGSRLVSVAPSASASE